MAEMLVFKPFDAVISETSSHFQIQGMGMNGGTASEYNAK